MGRCDTCGRSCSSCTTHGSIREPTEFESIIEIEHRLTEIDREREDHWNKIDPYYFHPGQSLLEKKKALHRRMAKSLRRSEVAKKRWQELRDAGYEGRYFVKKNT